MRCDTGGGGGSAFAADGGSDGPRADGGGECGRLRAEASRSRVDLARRYVFLCPTRLNAQFETLPHQVKDSALLVFRCSRQHVFPPARGSSSAPVSARICTGVESKATRGGTPRSVARPWIVGRFSKAFLEWLKEKEKEDSVFWYKPDRNLQVLSDFFQDKVCSLTEERFNPLKLDPEWWRTRFDRSRSRYLSNIVGLVEALNAHASESRHPWEVSDISEVALQELLFQSNPTLEPVVSWPKASSVRCLPRSPPPLPNPNKFNGYVYRPGHSGSAPGVAEDSRVVHWPERTADRMDDLHATWRAEETLLLSSRRAAPELKSYNLPFVFNGLGKSRHKVLDRRCRPFVGAAVFHGV